jgi:hypothetical protein
MTGCCCPSAVSFGRHRGGAQAAPLPEHSLQFKPLEAADRETLGTFLARHPQRIVGYSFSELTVWHSVYGYEWASDGQSTCFIKGAPDGDGLKHFMQPLGDFDDVSRTRFLEMLRGCAYPVRVMDVGGAFMARHHDFVMANFDIEDDPGKANYIYRTADLAMLAGKAYAKKRNLIAQARKLYDWTVKPVTPDNIAPCLKVLAGMAEDVAPPQGEEDDAGRNPAAVEKSRHQEEVAAITALERFSTLDYKGVLVEVAGQPAGFALYEDIGHDTAVIAFEKGLRQYKGMYQILNQETARAIADEGFAFINREEDMNLPGLRQAKDSYHPCEMVPSYTLRLKP